MTFETKYKRHLVDQADHEMDRAHSAIWLARSLARRAGIASPDLEKQLGEALHETSGFSVAMFAGMSDRTGACFDDDGKAIPPRRIRQAEQLKHYTVLHDLLSDAIENDQVRFADSLAYQDVVRILADVPK